MGNRTGQRILIVRLSAIGDVIVTTPVTRALREAMPEAFVAWVVEERSAEMVRGNPYVDEVIVWKRPRGVTLKALLALRRQLREHGPFDWAIDMQGLLRSALVARLSGARVVVGNTRAKEHADLLYHQRIPRRQDDRSSRQRCLDLLQPLGIRSEDRRMVLPVTAEDTAAAAGALRQAGVRAGAPYACLVPATTWKQKHWLEPGWAELADLLQVRRGLVPVFLGAPADAPMMDRIAGAARKPVVSLAGKTSLRSAAAVLAGARVTVAVDTALMHGSVAVGTPTVGVCGASGWPGFQDYPDFELVREDLPCSPCYHRPSCDGRFDCMRALTAERVLAAAERLLARCSAAPLVTV